MNFIWIWNRDFRPRRHVSCKILSESAPSGSKKILLQELTSPRKSRGFTADPPSIECTRNFMQSIGHKHESQLKDYHTMVVSYNVEIVA